MFCSSPNCIAEDKEGIDKNYSITSLKYQNKEASGKFVQFPYQDRKRWNCIENILKKLIEKPKNITSKMIAKVMYELSSKTHPFTGDPIEFRDDNYILLMNALDLYEREYYKRDHGKTEHFLSTVIPFVAKLVLESEAFLKPNSLPYLRRGNNLTVEISRPGVACLLANSFFCLWNRACYEECWEIFPSINFTDMYNNEINEGVKFNKCLMMLNYFALIEREWNVIKMGSVKDAISISRVHLDSIPPFINSQERLCPLQVKMSGSIDDEPNATHVDFANQYIGGASLSYGCVQEEIMFSISPEKNISRLICEKMEDNEAIIIRGARKFSNYSGYGEEFKYEGICIDESSHINEVCAIDALSFFGKNTASQFDPEIIERELLKSSAGFKYCKYSTISTGSWGCGVFRGDRQLKSVIQILSASYCKKSLVYYSFSSTDFAEQLEDFYQFLSENDITISSLYQGAIHVKKQMQKGETVFEALRKILVNNQK